MRLSVLLLLGEADIAQCINNLRAPGRSLLRVKRFDGDEQQCRAQLASLLQGLGAQVLLSKAFPLHVFSVLAGEFDDDVTEAVASPGGS